MISTLHALRRLAPALVALSAGVGTAGAQTATESPEQIRAIEAEVASMDAMRRFGVAQAAPKPEGAVRFATYNVMNLFDDQDDPALTGDQDDADMTKPLHERVAAARAIRAIDADVLCLQEIESLDALLWFRDQFLGGMGYEHVASVDAGDARGIEQAVLSRHPIARTQIWANAPLGGVHPEKYGNQENWLAGEPLKLRRSPLRVDVALPANKGSGEPRTVTLFVVHHKSGRHSGYWREAEAKWVVERVAEETAEHPDRPVLVLGDFNAEPRDGSVKTYLAAGFHDIFAKHPAGNSIISHESGRRIDLILANGPAMAQLLADKAFVLGTAARPAGVDWRDLPTFPGLASDHYPVVVDLAPSGHPQTTPKAD